MLSRSLSCWQSSSCGCRAEVLVFWPAVTWEQLSVPRGHPTFLCTRPPSQTVVQHGSLLLQSQQKRVTPVNRDRVIYRNIATEVSSHYICHLQLVERKSQVLPALKRRELHKGMKTRKQAPWTWGSVHYNHS